MNAQWAASPPVQLARASLWPAWSEIGAFSLGLLMPILLAANDGGYFEQAWGWAALLLMWAAGFALVVRRSIRLAALELAFIGALLALLLWTLFSGYWGASLSAAVRESERTLVYFSGAIACLTCVRTRSYRSLLTGLWSGVSLVCIYALATKLFPASLAETDELAPNRLSEPLGYWNALGLFAGLGGLLALGLVARAREPIIRAVAAASTVILLTTLYFTFSRGAWVALAVGVVFAILVDSRRLQLVTSLLAVAPASAAALLLAYESDALSQGNTTSPEAVSEGRSLAVAVACLAVGAALLSLLSTAFERRVRIKPRLRHAYGVALVLSVVVGLASLFASYGSPSTLARRTYDSVDRPLPTLGSDERRRLFTVSSPGRVQQWSVAWETYRAHPWLGSGAGSYERYWHEERPDAFKVRDAFSLYLETLTEQGPVGLALLVTALLLPIVAGLRARARGLAPFALGAYAAYLAHAGFEPQWEMPVVTLIAIGCGAAMLVVGRTDDTTLLSARQRFGSLAAVVALAGLSLVGLIGNSALAASDEARKDARFDKAEAEARKAIRWMPWSPEPWLELARAQRDQGDLAAARRSLRRAIAKEPQSWRLWYVLARVSVGKERDRAIARGLALNPLSPQISRLRAELAQVPVGLTARSVSSGVIDLSWSPSSGATGYRLERSTNGLGGWSVIARTAGASYRDRGLSPATRYHYRVRANLGTTETAASTPASAETYLSATQASADPRAERAHVPVGLTASSVSSGAVDLSWSPSSGATGYRLERSTNGLGGWSVIARTAGASYRDRGLSPATRYHYRVRANLGATETAASTPASAETYLAATEGPRGSWLGAYGADGYVLAAWTGTSDVAWLPKAMLSLDQGSRYRWQKKTTQARALRSADGDYRRAATFYDASELSLRLDFASAYRGTLHVYALDWDRLGRRERMIIADGSGTHTAELDGAFEQGVWVHAPINVASGASVTIRVIRTGGPNAVVSGIFLGSASEEASFGGKQAGEDR